jgi:hypothetical protein
MLTKGFVHTATATGTIQRRNLCNLKKMLAENIFVRKVFI